MKNPKKSTAKSEVISGFFLDLVLPRGSTRLRSTCLPKRSKLFHYGSIYRTFDSLQYDTKAKKLSSSPEDKITGYLSYSAVSAEARTRAGIITAHSE